MISFCALKKIIQNMCESIVRRIQFSLMHNIFSFISIFKATCSKTHQLIIVPLNHKFIIYVHMHIYYTYYGSIFILHNCKFKIIIISVH